MAEYLETLTIDEKNHFTDFDIECALSTYYRPGDGAFRRRREFVANRTNIDLPENKRNHRPQLVHMKRITALRDADYPDGSWRNTNGRPTGSGTAQSKVLLWRANHPTGKKIDCERETGLSRHTILKWWDTEMTENELPDPLDEMIDAMEWDEARRRHRERLKKIYDNLRVEDEYKNRIGEELAQYDKEDEENEKFFNGIEL